MGIAPYKTFTFDGVSSDTYGVYITGEGVFNAPERDVEMIDIHGRNGAYAFDNGRFMNIKVKYKIGMYDVNESNFATKMSNFRNWLCSKVGYVRLSDEYNPNEYRMAVYSGGLEVSHEFLIAGEAEITFDCKPQRWLKSGETATSVADGGTLTNPTLFDASPLLEVTGYGDIEIGSKTINVAQGVPIGNIIVSQPMTSVNFPAFAFLDTTYANNGDALFCDDNYFGVCSSIVDTGGANVVSYTVNSGTWCEDGATAFSGRTFKPVINIKNTVSFSYGTTDGIINAVTYTITLDDSTTKTLVFDVSIDYYSNEMMVYQNETLPTGWSLTESVNHINAITLDSSSLANKIYIDLDIGEAYVSVNGVIVSVNNSVNLGNELPILPTGTTTINYDNTITDLKIAPRWWKV